MLFVDEIHRLNRAIEEILYPALEDFRLDIIVGSGRGGAHADARLAAVHARRRDDAHRAADDAAARSLRHDFPAGLLRAGGAREDRATLGAHPRRRDRGGRCGRDRAALARHAANREPDPEARARRGAGASTTARSRTRSRGRRSTLLEVDGNGLERIDRELLGTILSKFGGGPVGLSTLAVALGEEPDTIEDVYEPYLLQLGFLQRTPRGRIVTELGREHVGAGRRRLRSCFEPRPLGSRRGRAVARRLRRPHPPADRALHVDAHRPSGRMWRWSSATASG